LFQQGSSFSKEATKPPVPSKPSETAEVAVQ
jgi:hypothetical protein